MTFGMILKPKMKTCKLLLIKDGSLQDIIPSLSYVMIIRRSVVLVQVIILGLV